MRGITPPTCCGRGRCITLPGLLCDLREEVAAGRRFYRLPTEAEWEYAARAGTSTIYFTGDDLASLQGFANVADQSLKTTDPQRGGIVPWDDGFPKTAPVGSFKPNAFGLYDMLGNVNEWCEDYRDFDYYKVSPHDDPTGPKTGRMRVARGGGWGTGINRCGFRYGYMPYFRGEEMGVRIVCEIHPGATFEPSAE